MDHYYNPMRILLLSDIHANFPALQAIEDYFSTTSFDSIVNCGDSLVYAPFPNETLDWLRQHKVVSILGNTDRKVLEILNGEPFLKPRKEDKRIMYTSTVSALTSENKQYLGTFTLSATVPLTGEPENSSSSLCLFHGSPADPDEFLFPDTPDKHFKALAKHLSCPIVVTGHSHMPYTKYFKKHLFINPGSAGRMFDSDPRCSCAVLEVTPSGPSVQHYRIPYNIDQVVSAIREQDLPEIYATMFQIGEKLN